MTPRRQNNKENNTERNAECVYPIMNEKNELTPDEESELSALVKASYPSPKSGMAGRVNEMIAAVRAAQRKRRSLILRYGSLAACAVLIAGVALAVVPRLAKGGKAIMQDSAAPEETAEVYSLTAYDECEGCNGTVEKPAESAFDMLMSAADLDPASHPTSNGQKFTEEENVGLSVGLSGGLPTPSFTANNEAFSTDNTVKSAGASPSASAFIDIDSDGVIEYCTVTYVTEPQSALLVTASADDEVKYETVFPTEPCTIGFEKADGQMLIRKKDSATDCVTYYSLAVDGNELVLIPKEQ